MLTFLTAALAFSAPPSLTRRDMYAQGVPTLSLLCPCPCSPLISLSFESLWVRVVGMGAAAAAMVQAPAFAVGDNPYAGAADRKRADKVAAEKAYRASADTPYAKIAAQAKLAEANQAKPPATGAFYSNGKSVDGGVAFRKPSDPNGCSDVSVAQSRLNVKAA